MCDGSSSSFSLNSGRFGYNNRTPSEIPNDPRKVISWLLRMQLFLGSEGLEHTITTTNPTDPVYVISCKDHDFFVSIHVEKLVAEHRKAWEYLLEVTCNTEIETKWSLAAVFPRCGKLFRDHTASIHAGCSDNCQE